MKKRSLGLMALFLLLAVPVRAETLDEDSIRKVYGDIKSVIRDPVKSRAILEDRLDEHYVLKTDVIRHLPNKQPETFSASLTKEQAIQDTVDNIARMKMDKYDSNIASIQFSGDRKYAYINDVTASAGTVSIPIKDSSKMANSTYDGREKCSLIVGLVEDHIKIMQSQCDDDITLTPQ